MSRRCRLMIGGVVPVAFASSPALRGFSRSRSTIFRRHGSASAAIIRSSVRSATLIRSSPSASRMNVWEGLSCASPPRFGWPSGCISNPRHNEPSWDCAIILDSAIQLVNMFVSKQAKKQPSRQTNFIDFNSSLPETGSGVLELFRGRAYTCLLESRIFRIRSNAARFLRF